MNRIIRRKKWPVTNLEGQFYEQLCWGCYCTSEYKQFFSSKFSILIYIFIVCFQEDHTYYFAAEFATPMRTLHGMGSSVICGLTADKMKKEAHLFTDKLEGIMKKDIDGHNCTILKLTGNLSLQSSLESEKYITIYMYY